MANVAVIHDSSTGTHHATAHAVAEGAGGAGAEVRVRLVAGDPAWEAFVERSAKELRAELADLERAHAVVLGAPTRLGDVAAQLEARLDTAGQWFQGKLANKVHAGFTPAQDLHGGQESTLLALDHSFDHFGGHIVTPGHTDPSVSAGGDPHGVSVTAAHPPGAADLAHARHLGERVAEVAQKLAR